MEFLPCQNEDIPTIFAMYDAAVAHQKAVSNRHWLPFDPQVIADEIDEGRQWKIVVDGEIAVVFVVTYSDPDIWGERDREPAVYLHRIVTHPAFRGRNYVQEVVKWAIQHGKANGKRFVRLDTWADNPKLKSLYLDCGFKFLGVASPANPAALPKHYSVIILAYFELDIAQSGKISSGGE